MTIVTVHTTVMGFRLSVTPSGVIPNTGISIMEFAKNFMHYQYDSLLRKYILVNKYYHFDRTNQVCYFPLYALDQFKRFLTLQGYSLMVDEVKPCNGSIVEYHMLPFVEYKSEIQKNAVEYLTSPTSGPVRGLGLQTGFGKTVSAIWAFQKIGRRTIVTMTSRLEQWFKEIQKYTTLEEDDIYIVAGEPSLTKLFTQIDKQIFPKIILTSTKTLRLYLEYGDSYKHLPHPTEMCEKLGVGIIATDEAHEHLLSNFLFSIIFNPAIFIPITATFVASDPFVRDIFDNLIPKKNQFVGGEYKRYTNITSYIYKNGGQFIKPYHYKGRQGYSQQIFEKFLMSKKGKQVLDPLIYTAIIPIVREHYISIADDGEKFLFLCSSTALCDHLEGIFRREFNKSVSSFYTGRPTTILENFDIILSTPGSAGTGRDIKNLRTCFAFEMTQSEARNLQFLGRLRDFPSVKNTPEYVTLAFNCIPQHVRYTSVRSVLYGPRAKSFKHRTIG